MHKDGFFTRIYYLLFWFIVSALRYQVIFGCGTPMVSQLILTVDPYSPRVSILKLPTNVGGSANIIYIILKLKLGNFI